METFESHPRGIESRRCRSRRVHAIAFAVAVASVQAYERFTSVCEAAPNVTLTDGDKGGTTSFTGTSNHWSASCRCDAPRRVGPQRQLHVRSSGHYRHRLPAAHAYQRQPHVQRPFPPD